MSPQQQLRQFFMDRFDEADFRALCHDWGEVSYDQLPLRRFLFHENQNFTGREEALAGLHAALNAGENAAVTKTTAGMGGLLN